MRSVEQLEKRLMIFYNDYREDVPTESASTTRKYEEGINVLSLWEKHMEVTQNFTKDFVAHPYTPRVGLEGKLVLIFKRFFRKGTKYIFDQFCQYIYTFESKLMEYLGDMIQGIAALDSRIAKNELNIIETQEKWVGLFSSLQTQMDAIQDNNLKLQDSLVDQIEGLKEKLEIQKRQFIEEVKIQREQFTEKLAMQREQFTEKLKMQREEFTEKLALQDSHFQSVCSELMNMQREEKWYSDLYRQRVTQMEERLQTTQLKMAQISGELNGIYQINAHCQKPQKVEENVLSDSETIIPIQYIGRNYGFTSYSQCGEDGIVNYLLFVMLRRDPANIRYLDIGCNDYRYDNNTFFLYRMGASGVAVDANPVCAETIRKHRTRDIVINAGVGPEDMKEMTFYVMSNYGLSSFSKESVQEAIVKNPENKVEKTILVPVLGINTLFQEYFAQTKVNILSIDAEGIDIDILRALDYEQYKPEIIIVETIDYAPWVAIEHSRQDIKELMLDKGYVEYAVTGVNSIYIDPHILQ